MGRPPHNCLRCGKCCMTYDHNKPCKHLSWSKDKKAICLIYNDRPQDCRDYPIDGACIALMEDK